VKDVDVDALRARLFYRYEPDATSLFAVLDGARYSRIHWMLRETDLEFDSLFSGPLSPELRAAAPYIVRLTPDHPLTDRILTEGWGRSWGIFAASQSSLRAVRRHLKALLRVRREAGRLVYFRHYDPRVFRAFLPSCDAEQLRSMFGPIHRFEVESADGTALLRFRETGTGLGTWAYTLGDVAQANVRDEIVARQSTAPSTELSGPFVVRRRQVEALSRARREAFETRMVEHLQAEFPAWASAIDTVQRRAFVRHGIARAEGYGFKTELALARYLHVMAELGERFDEASEHAWATSLLRSPLAPDIKMRRLQDAATYQLEAWRIARGRIG